MSASAQTPTPPLAGRRILLGVTGGIACYKAAALCSSLSQAGASVRVLMTDAATQFVTPLTFRALSGQTVMTSLWQADDRPDSQHIGLARWAELLVIAPATADILAKLAAGFCDNILTLTAAALPAGTPVLMAPAMNAMMWENPITQRNLATLTQLLKYRTIGPEQGWQACRTAGPGRMSEPQAIHDAVVATLTQPV